MEALQIHVISNHDLIPQNKSRLLENQYQNTTLLTEIETSCKIQYTRKDNLTFKSINSKVRSKFA